jgi:hypothetical protein
MAAAAASARFGEQLLAMITRHMGRESCLLMGCCCCVQISQAFKPDHDDVEYNQGKFMLRSLGLQVSSCEVGVR